MIGRKYDAAEKQLRKTLELDPNFPDAHYWLALTHWMREKYDEALAHIQHAFTLSGGEVRILCVFSALKALAGHKEEALIQLQEFLKLADQKYVAPVLLSGVYFGLGDFDTMFDLLEKGFQGQDLTLRYSLRLQCFDVLRLNPRFQHLQRRLGIAP
jgi:tetratricopeptide (TPR) repeat protein